MARKAPGLALEAFAKLRESHNAEFWFIGDGPLRAELEEMAERLGVAADVKFWGWVDHLTVPQLLSKSDVFLFTSLRDTCPMPVLEAMARGLPCVTLDLHGATNLRDDAVVKVPVGEADQLINDIADALVMLAGSRAMRQRYGDAAWECANLEHRWRHRFAGVERAYATILGDEMTQIYWDEAHGRAAD